MNEKNIGNAFQYCYNEYQSVPCAIQNAIRTLSLIELS